jgi:molybdopterin synthase sulfur carrier subunit
MFQSIVTPLIKALSLAVDVPHVVFTSHLQRFVSCPEHDVEAGTVRAALARIFEANPRLRDYILDDQGALRKHVILFVDGRRTRELEQAVSSSSEIHVLQALSGG